MERFGVVEAEMRSKLEELQLQSKDGLGYRAPFVDPTLDDYEKAVEALYGEKWGVARKHLQTVIEQGERPDLAARARQLLKMAQEREEGDVETDDPFLEAVAAKNRGDLETALDLCNRGGRRGKDERFAYLAASVMALEGAEDEALELLGAAIEMNRENRIHAYHDPDFEQVRELPEFRELLEGA